MIPQEEKRACGNTGDSQESKTKAVGALFSLMIRRGAQAWNQFNHELTFAWLLSSHTTDRLQETPVTRRDPEPLPFQYAPESHPGRHPSDCVFS